ncbi:sulfocyanin-like copper-binding protein [Ferviditalea candida]|uniref:Sulfocyanin-like copper-binding protein n=1 Tax=Ferviditalea candida TaxID=3108399 RepID=A0ABU5ZHP8_9BACL|nr:sulfocyanin-like copper-binding protein [Paenibacillaceae bacterium T2]
MKQSKLLAFLIACVFFVVSGCASQANSSNSSWLKADASTKTVMIQLIAGYNDANDYDNFNGYANGQMVITIPEGYHVNMQFSNQGGIPAGVGVYDSQNRLAFQGAGDSIQDILGNPTPGVMPGDTQTYKFVADKPGTYRIANLINRFPQFRSTQQDIGMWVALKVVQNGEPGISF